MNIIQVIQIIEELEKIGCHETAKAIWQFYLNF